MTVYLDDLTGDESEDVETVQFALDGIDLEIDLDTKNATALREAFAPYIEAGRRRQQSAPRRSHHRRSRGPARTQLDPGVDPKRAREWARRQGYRIPARGRLPRDVTDAYRQHLASV
jgi:hypothetical protein